MMYKLIPTFKSQIKTAYRYKYWASFDCDGCQKKIKDPQCKSCQKMINYFNVFNIPEKYKVDPNVISQKAKQLQKEFHPDKNIQNHDIRKSGEYSAYINHAKSTLLDDLKRAVYLMELKGIHIDEQTKIEDTQFMMDIFELQEEIEQANFEQASQIAKRIQGILNELQTNLNKFFESDNLQKCKEFVYKYKYLHRALQNCKNKFQKVAQAK